MVNEASASVPSIEQLPIFDGHPSKAEDWLRDFERLSLENSLQPAVKLQMARSCLTDVAEEWLINREEAFQTWEEFTEDFSFRFSRQEALDADARLRLRRLRHANEGSFCDHLTKVLNLCDNVDPQMSERQRISWFLKSVRDDYRPALVFLHIESLDVLKEKCELIDSIEPFVNKSPEKPAKPVEPEGNQVTFRTKTPDAVRQQQPAAPIRAGTRGYGRPRQGRPVCSYCGRFGHYFRNCYARRPW